MHNHNKLATAILLVIIITPFTLANDIPSAIDNDESSGCPHSKTIHRRKLLLLKDMVKSVGVSGPNVDSATIKAAEDVTKAVGKFAVAAFHFKTHGVFKQ